MMSSGYDSPVRGNMLPASMTRAPVGAASSALLLSSSSDSWRAYAAAAAVACGTPPLGDKSNNSNRPGSASAAAALAASARRGEQDSSHSNDAGRNNNNGSVNGGALSAVAAAGAEELTAQMLRDALGFEDLFLVAEAELTVDATRQSAFHLSGLIPNVVQLRLSRSNLPSVRHLGTGFTSLRVLWLSASNVHSLSGIQSGHVGDHLKELYVAFNHIRDVSPLLGLQQLEVLDLEGNLIRDADDDGGIRGGGAAPSVLHLLIANKDRNLPALKTLTLAGNPFIARMGGERAYRRAAARALQRLSDSIREDAETEGAGDSVRSCMLETLDDTPVEKLLSALAASRAAAAAKKEKKRADSLQQPTERQDGVVESDRDDDDNDEEGRDDFDDDEEDAAAVSELTKQQREVDSVRDELNVVNGAIRTQLALRTGEMLVAEEEVRTTSRLMSRQRSLAPEEQRARFRVATASGDGRRPTRASPAAAAPAVAAAESAGVEEGVPSRGATPPVVATPAPPTMSVFAARTTGKLSGAKPPAAAAAAAVPLPPTAPRESRSRGSSAATTDDDDGGANVEEAAAVTAVGSLIHRRRSAQKLKLQLQQQQDGGDASADGSAQNSPARPLAEQSQQPFAMVLANRIAANNSNSSIVGGTKAKKKTPTTASAENNGGGGSSYHEERYRAALRKQKMESFDAQCQRILADIDAQERAGADKEPLFRYSMLPDGYNHMDPEAAAALALGDDDDADASGGGDDSFAVRRPATASRTHKERMAHARRLLRLAKRKQDKAALERLREQQQQRRLDDDDDENGSDGSSSSLASSSSSSSAGDEDDMAVDDDDDDPSVFVAQQPIHHRPMTDDEVLRRLLADKETNLAQLKKDIESHVRFETADAAAFESLDWQGKQGDCSMDAL